MSFIYNMADTWNNGSTIFTAIKMNVTDTASNAASLLLDLQVAAASKFNVSKLGNVTMAGNTLLSNDATSIIIKAARVDFTTASTLRCSVNSDGTIIFWADNTYDIGASGTLRPKDLYLGGKITVGSTTMLTSSVAFTNGAAAAARTLTNAPTAGNPTKWVPIVDNGTTRYIPAW